MQMFQKLLLVESAVPMVVALVGGRGGQLQLVEAGGFMTKQIWSWCFSYSLDRPVIVPVVTVAPPSGSPWWWCVLIAPGSSSFVFRNPE